MEIIRITDIPGYKIGQVEDEQAATGATVIICADGMAAGVDVRGGGPASRDSRTLDPLAAAEEIHALLLAGGSAYGLDAAGGVMRYLEEHEIGLEVGPVRVPLVCQSDIFDLLVGSSSVRPDANMGYAACEAAEEGNYQDGNFGAGCGATVGKVLGGDYCTKTGIGSYAVKIGELEIGAIVAVNSLGDIRDPETGKIVAGLLTEDRKGFRSSTDALYALYEQQATASAASADPENASPASGNVVTNTTIGAILTNAKLNKAQLCKVAGMTHDGYARTISPVHTTMDGDTVYTLSTCTVPAQLDLVGTLAAEVMAKAVLCAVHSAQDAHGIPCAKTVLEG